MCSLPVSLAAGKPRPNSMPRMAGIPKTIWAMRFSMPPNMGSPHPAGTPTAAHSMTPPRESSFDLAARMACSISCAAPSRKTGKGFFKSA